MCAFETFLCTNINILINIPTLHFSGVVACQFGLAFFYMVVSIQENFLIDGYLYYSDLVVFIFIGCWYNLSCTRNNLVEFERCRLFFLAFLIIWPNAILWWSSWFNALIIYTLSLHRQLWIWTKLYIMTSHDFLFKLEKESKKSFSNSIGRSQWCIVLVLANVILLWQVHSLFMDLFSTPIPTDYKYTCTHASMIMDP